MLILLAIYLYAHYGFATITAHVSALYVPFIIVMLAAGVPAHLAVVSMSYLSSLGSSLTHYGTTTSPIYFGAGYLSQAAWWRIGLAVATLNAIVWMAVGSVWWKLLGWW
jgi:DASS family divalent anion:Na+ symporter